MNAYRRSKHACRRMQQRAMSKADVELIDRFGVEVNDGGVLMTHKAADAAMEKLNRDLRSLERAWRKTGETPTQEEAEAARGLRSTIKAVDRLRYRKLVFDESGATLITCYRATSENQRRSLRAPRRCRGRASRRRRAVQHRNGHVPGDWRRL
jgi:hypothetical protein